MKHIYFLLAALFTSFSFGQASDLFFSKYGEGSSSNKFIEIYNGTGADVDLSLYTVELYTNGSTTNPRTETLSGTLVSGDVYVIANAQADQTILNAADITSQVTWFNGDDALVLKKNGVIIDVIGEVGVDPGTGWDVAGVSNATANHTLIRKSNVCDPTTDWAASAGTNANDSQWIVLGIDQGWNDLGSFSGCSTQPELIVTSPSTGQVFNPETTDVTIEFQVNNFVVAQNGGDGYIVYSVNGNPPVDKFDTNPIQLTGLSQGQYMVILELVDNNGNPLNPPVSDNAEFSIASYIQVPDLATLRAGNLGDYYEVTGEVIITAGENYGSYFKGFVQDATAGIMIYDPNFAIDYTQYTLYDGVTGVKGQLDEFRGMLELIPTTDPGGPSSSGNTIIPEVVSVADFNNNHDDYESELVKLVGVTIDPGTDTDFQINTNYDLTTATDTTTLRVIFSDLAGTPIPSGQVDVTGIAGEYNGSAQIYPRDENDISATQNISENTIPGLKVYPNPVSGDFVYIQTLSNGEKIVVISDLSGKEIFKTELNSNGKIILSLDQGMYLMKIYEGAKTSVIKLLVK